ncbi:Beta-galactosidase 8 [Vitis vinifera]|uniref:Beta-galactosidase 8 n=1 Tax=Vitis vinifera TaxID=29760 RepID=A0A438JI05_VITVI|nr:Beta-galactosidase 8 [Vitis vinifera]
MRSLIDKQLHLQDCLPNYHIFIYEIYFRAGFIRQPKWGHLRDLHKAIKQCEEFLISSDPTYLKLGKNLEVYLPCSALHTSIIERPMSVAAFLANFDSSLDANVTFNGNSYFLPAWSVSILPDCKNVIFNHCKVDSGSENRMEKLHYPGLKASNLIVNWMHTRREL